jgi:hydrogenase maturation protease
MKRLFVGIGNLEQGDYGVGCWIAERLERALPVSCAAVSLDGEPADLMDSWKDVGHVTLIAAISSGLLPGTLFRVDLNIEELPEQLNAYSSHPFGLSQCIALARKLKKIPPVLDFIGIESGVNVSSTVLSAKVQHSAEELIDEILQDSYQKTAD